MNTLVDLCYLGLAALVDSSLFLGLELYCGSATEEPHDLEEMTDLRVEQHQSTLSRLRRPDNGEHSLASLVMGDFGDRDSGAGQSSDFRNLGTAFAAGDKKSATVQPLIVRLLYSHDAAHHVAWDGDILGSKVGVGSRWQRGAWSSRLWSAEGDTGSADSSFSTERVAHTGWEAACSDTGSPDTSSRPGHSLCSKTSGQHTGVSSRSRVVLDSSLSSLPVLQKALGNLEHSSLDGINGTLYLDDTLGGLGEHLLGSDHSSTGSVLDLLDLGTSSTDDSSHQVMRDEKSNGGERSDGWGRKGRVGKGGLEQKSSDFAISRGDAFQLSGSREDSVLNAWNYLGDTGFDASELTNIGNGRSTLANDDTGLFGADERPQSELMLIVCGGRAAGITSSWRCGDNRLLEGFRGDGF